MYSKFHIEGASQAALLFNQRVLGTELNLDRVAFVPQMFLKDVMCSVTRSETPKVQVQNCCKNIVCVQVLSHHIFFLIFHVLGIKLVINEMALYF